MSSDRNPPVGSSSMTQPMRPSIPSESVTFTGPLNENQVISWLRSLQNRCDLISLRLDLLDEAARVLLEGCAQVLDKQGYPETLEWFSKHKERLARMNPKG
jgi:hypothetical protein